MARAERILGFFPAVYGAAERGKLLHEVVRRLAAPVEEAETHLFRIQRAHRLRVAEQAEDIVRLAAALDLGAFHFEDILSDGALAYDLKLRLMRQRVERVARIHLEGLGTPRAVIEGAAAFLDAAVVAEGQGEAPIKHLDRQGFSHRAVIEIGHLRGRPRARLELHESPLRRRKLEPAPRWAPTTWQVENPSIAAAPSRWLVRGVGERTVLPALYCRETGEGLFYNGAVPGGETLVVDAVGGASLEGRPVDDAVVYFTGGAYDLGPFGGADFVRQQGTAGEPLIDPEDAAVSPLRSRKPVPEVPLGSSRWHFKVNEGVCDGDRYDAAVYGTPRQPIGLYDGDVVFDGCVFDFPASAESGMAWDERTACAFKLLLPHHLPRPSPEEEAETAGEVPGRRNDVSRIGEVMARFRAAGVRSYVDRARDAWILGQGVLRDRDAAGGEGATHHTTRIRHRRADLLIPSQPTAS